MEGSTRSREGFKKRPLVESEYEGDGKPLVKAAKTNNEASTSTYGTEIETSERARSEEVRKIIENGLENIQQSCEKLREENRAETEKKLEQLVKHTADLSQKHSNEYKLAKKDLSSYIKFDDSFIDNVVEPFNKKIIEQFTRSTAADLIFYYLINDEQPETRPNTDTTSRFYHSHNWYELCSFIMAVYHTEFYNRLDNNSAVLEYVINKHPRFLLNQLSYLSVYTLCEYLPRERIHEMMMTVRDENGQTCLFYCINGVLPLRLYNYYQNHTDKLYEILSIQNVNKQTVLHVDTIDITVLLIFTYTPEQRDELTKLITIPDINNKTALDTAEGWVRDCLSWLIDQAKFPRYVLNGRPNVLIIYNTDQRDGAEEEAKTIYDAFESTKLFDTKLHKDKEEDEILRLIEESANKDCYKITQSALIVVLLSHGSVGVIDDCEGRPVSFTSIESAMCQKKLQNRPKILIAQCCQVRDDMSEHYKHSKKHDIRVPHPREPYIPKNPDFCAIMSSVPGEASEREVFIPKLAEQIRNCEDNEDIELLVKRVCQQMLGEHKSQTPVILSTLKASFCAMNRDQYTKQILLS